jgi:hypothetical protein
VDQDIIRIVNRNFSELEASEVLSELGKISLSDVMARSEKNLLNTHLAILKLAKGDPDRVSHYVRCAKRDFRDVIFWAGEE